MQFITQSGTPVGRTGKAAHTIENAGAARLTLTPEELSMLDRAFPAPNHKTPLDMR